VEAAACARRSKLSASCKTAFLAPGWSTARHLPRSLGAVEPFYFGGDRIGAAKPGRPKSGSQLTRRWREMDSNPRSPASRTTVSRHHVRRAKAPCCNAATDEKFDPEHRYHNVPKTAGPDCQLASSIVGAVIAGTGQRAARRFLKFR
jgi:hypothetical protein